MSGYHVLPILVNCMDMFVLVLLDHYVASILFSLLEVFEVHCVAPLVQSGHWLFFFYYSSKGLSKAPNFIH